MKQKQITKLKQNQNNVYLCSYCFTPVKKRNKLIKCSMKNCNLRMCKGCITFINNKPYCNNCVVEIVRSKSLLIITKGEI